METSDDLLDELFRLDHRVDNFFGTYKYTNKDKSRPELQEQMEDLMLKRQALEKQLEETMTILFRPHHFNIYQRDRANWGTKVSLYYIKNGVGTIEHYNSSDEVSAVVFRMMNSSFKAGWLIEQPVWLLRSNKVEKFLENN